MEFYSSELPEKKRLFLIKNYAESADKDLEFQYGDLVKLTEFNMVIPAFYIIIFNKML